MAQLDSISLSVLENAFEGIYLLDNNRKITYWNNGAERITGFSAKDVLGMCCKDNILSHQDGKKHVECSVNCPVLKTFENGQIYDTTAYMHHKSGEILNVSIRTAPIKNNQGEMSGVIQLFVDNNNYNNISQEKLNELVKYSFLDIVTGIPNRRYVEGKLSSILEKAEYNNDQVFIVIVELQNLKELNEKIGSNEVDKYLIKTVGNLKKSLKEQIIISRWSSNRFMIIISDSNKGLFPLMLSKIKGDIDKVVKISNGMEIAAESICVGTTVHSEENIESLTNRIDMLLKEAKINNIPIKLDKKL